MINAIRRLRAERRDQITTETIEAVQDRNKYLVKGVLVPASGTAQLRAGEQHPVVSRDGVPRVVLAHSARRAQFPAQQAQAVAGIVEELFIALESTPSSPRPTIWFRNYNLLVELKYADEDETPIANDFASAPRDVFWGVNNDIFCVVEGTGAATQYHVYRLNRPGNTAEHPTDGNQKIIRATTVTVKEALYTITPASMAEVPLIDITLELRRDSHEPVFEQVWNYDSGSCGGSCFFVFQLVSATLNDSTNVNRASVDRVVHMTAQGATIHITVDGQGVGEAGITVANINRPTAEIASAIVDENNDLVWNLKIRCNVFSIGQGNPTTGLTGEYKRKGPGNTYPFGFFNVFASNDRSDPDYPFKIDDVGPLDFNGHGNPGGVLTTHITETHSVMVNAKQGSVVTSTLAAAKTLRIDETTDGQVPYIASQYIGFTDLGSHDPAVGPDHGYTYPFRTTVYNPIFGPITVFNMGAPRLYGITKSDRSLFAASLPYAPEDGVDRTTQIFDSLDEQIGFTTERTDGFDAFNFTPGFFLPSNQCVESHYTIPTTDIIDRYRIDVEETPFYSASGQLYRFVAVLRTPTNTPGSGHTTDPLQLGIFVMVGTTKHTVQDYTTVTTTELPVFKTGNTRHVIWAYGSQLWIADFLRELKRTWSNTLTRAETLQLTNPDFLYSYDEKKLFFVRGWDRATGALTLDDLEEGYPLKDTPVALIGGLEKLPKDIGAEEKDNHTIVDTLLVPKAYRS